MKGGTLEQTFFAIPRPVVTFNSRPHLDELIGKLTGTEMLAVRCEIPPLASDDQMHALRQA